MRPDADDEQFEGWIAAAKDGDPSAFDALTRALDRPLAGFAAARGATDPEGLVNETLVRAFSNVEGFEGNAPQFRAWVFRIARNLLIDERRKAARRPDTVATAPDQIPELPSSETTPHRLDQSERIEAILDRLTPEQREVLLLRIVAGLGVDETAEVLGRRPGAVRALQHRALERLRREFSVRP